MARCSGCSGDRCSCVIQAGANVTVSGAGTLNNPFIIGAAGGGGGGGGGDFAAGDIIMHGSPIARAGWLVANGSAVSRVIYAALFTEIGTSYGAGDGVSTFNLPDLAGRFPLGADGSHPLGAVSGSETTFLNINNLPAHSHSMNHNHGAFSDVQGNHVHTANFTINPYPGGVGADAIPFGGNPVTHFAYGAGYMQSAGAHSHGITVNTMFGTTGNTGSATPFNIMPPWTGVTFLIKT